MSSVLSYQGLGCGPQETFRNCADVRIVRTAAELPVTDNPRAIMIRDETSKTGVSPLIVRSQVGCVEFDRIVISLLHVRCVLQLKRGHCSTVCQTGARSTVSATLPTVQRTCARV